MNITLREITIEELVAGYNDTGEDGVRGYGVKLAVRSQTRRRTDAEGSGNATAPLVVQLASRGGDVLGSTLEAP